jgi:hypothetical protein
VANSIPKLFFIIANKSLKRFIFKINLKGRIESIQGPEPGRKGKNPAQHNKLFGTGAEFLGERRIPGQVVAQNNANEIGSDAVPRFDVDDQVVLNLFVRF